MLQIFKHGIHLDVLVINEVAQLQCSPQHHRCDVPDNLCAVLLVVRGIPLGQAHLALPAKQEYKPDGLSGNINFWINSATTTSK